MPKSIIRLLLAAIMLLVPAGAFAEDYAVATSPDGSITLTFSINDGYPMYSVARNDTPIFTPSRMGFHFSDAYPMERFMSFESSEVSAADTSWEQPWGERRTVLDRHTELLVKIYDMGGRGDHQRRDLAIRFRLFDNGVGFRYEFPERPDGAAWNIAEEVTEFNLAQNGTAWWQIAGNRDRYENLYNETALDAVATTQTPITMQLADGTHLAIHEAALVDYAGYWFARVEGLNFRTRLAPSGNGPKVSRQGAFTTPWRTIRIADDAAGLYDNDLELNLNEPNALGDVSWIQPMKFIGIWWGMFLEDFTWNTGPRHGATTANARRYIDFAADQGIEGLLIEGWNVGWDGRWWGDGRDFDFTQPTPDFDINTVADYARQRGVHLIGHHETGGNIANYEAQLDEAMAFYDDLDIQAIKTGYVANAGGIIAQGPTPGSEAYEWHDGQMMQRHFVRVLQAAGRHHITIDSHEAIKDTGLRRTYPNWLARESARGMEYNAGYVGANPPSHEPTLLFTRMLAGPMDFTPGILSLEVKGGQPLGSTLARQLGLYVVLYSPIQMVADTPEQLARFPREMAFIRDIPTDWEETRTLAGEVGDYAVMARKGRASDQWYVGGVTDEEAREVTVDLSFLDPGHDYVATIWRDTADADYRTDSRHHIEQVSYTVNSGQQLALHMGAGGGFAMQLRPVR